MKDNKRTDFIVGISMLGVFGVLLVGAVVWAVMQSRPKPKPPQVQKETTISQPTDELVEDTNLSAPIVSTWKSGELEKEGLHFKYPTVFKYEGGTKPSTKELVGGDWATITAPNGLVIKLNTSIPEKKAGCKDCYVRRSENILTMNRSIFLNYSDLGSGRVDQLVISEETSDPLGILHTREIRHNNKIVPMSMVAYYKSKKPGMTYMPKSLADWDNDVYLPVVRKIFESMRY